MSTDTSASDLKSPTDLATSDTTGINTIPEYGPAGYHAYGPADGFHILLCGLRGTGKQNIICRIIRDHYHEEPTCLSEYMHDDYDGTDITYKYKPVFVEFEPFIVLPSNLTKFETVTTSLVPPVRYSNAIIIVYDVTDRHSFNAVPVFHRIAREASSMKDTMPYLEGSRLAKKVHPVPAARKPIIIMANKCDVPEKDWAVTREEGRQLAGRDKATIFLEVSAKTGIGLERMSLLIKILDQLYSAGAEVDTEAKVERRPVRIWESVRTIVNRFLVKIKGIRNS